MPDVHVCGNSHGLNLALRRHTFLHQTNFWMEASQILNSPELRYGADSSSDLKLVIKFQISNILLNSSQILSSDLAFIQILWRHTPKYLSIHHTQCGTPWGPTLMVAPP